MIAGSARRLVGPVSILLWFGEIAMWICSFCLSEAARTTDRADPVPEIRTECFLGRKTKKNKKKEPTAVKLA